ncbi:benzoate-CoA ligase family protein [Amorphus orientalis]|uniref:4-hydroxybenzoate-CoA ligase n=1 Tax=Amorphus orientalis TaxID=649198 RepID=A0AAE4AV94_9HYPH|nr:benzoate-CoA ligase family protein [Amorphus orientalis]MDQ0316469.1 4-hydroxybenzoate-CoA ligase [Amorphus orientalis]
MQGTSGNAAEYFVDRHLAAGRSDKTAFIERGGNARSITYGALAADTDRMVGLYRRHGIRREDRAMMLVLDTVDFPVIFWGSLKAGVVPIPVNTLLSADLWEVILDDSRATALFVSSELLEWAAPLVEREGLKVFVVGGDPGPHLDFGAELAASDPGPSVDASPDECAFWLYSSGSTGRPKGVRHVHSSLQATSDTYASKVLKIREDDTVFSAAKLFFAYGLGNAMTFPMSVGATTALLAGRPTPDSVFDVLEKTRPTVFCGVPTLYAAMLAGMNGSRPEGLDRLRICVSAGEALPEEVGTRWREKAGVDILDGVGSTEMLHIFLSNAEGDICYGTSGRAVPGYELRLVDENGQDVEVGEIGELLVNGPSAADGYWNQRDKTRSTFEGRWTRTGDKYELRPDGRLVYCGRTDDMFKVSGIWVAPFEIEQALVSHPAVLEAAVVPAHDESGLEKPRAFVVLKGGAVDDALAAELRDHVKERVGKWKYPRWIEFVEELPKTATGKIQRFKLRQLEGEVQ